MKRREVTDRQVIEALAEVKRLMDEYAETDPPDCINDALAQQGYLLLRQLFDNVPAEKEGAGGGKPVLIDTMADEEPPEDTPEQARRRAYNLRCIREIKRRLQHGQIKAGQI